MFCPYSTQLQTAAKSFSKGNFALWFNKLIPLNNETKCKPCNKSGNDKEVVQYYESFYNGLKNNITLKNLLDAKQRNQKEFCEFYENAGCKIISYQAKLKSPLITGIGQTHPNEIGMVFDHTMGIPFIPASSVKGIVRFAHMLELIRSRNRSYIDSDKDGEYIIESDLQTLIPDIFGGDSDIIKNEKKKTKKWRGKVIFLDAYPDNVPDLHVDIMNPHYGQYYSDDENKTPPADYLDPTPIKFLTVKPGTVFTFRALAPKDSDFIEPAKTAFQKALEDEGVGAKTAVGYGRFEIQRRADSKDAQIVDESIEPQEKSPLNRMLDALNLINTTETGRISGEIINNMEKNLTTNEEKIIIAKAIKDKISIKAFKKLDKKKSGYLSNLIKT